MEAIARIAAGVIDPPIATAPARRSAPVRERRARPLPSGAGRWTRIPTSARGGRISFLPRLRSDLG